MADDRKIILQLEIDAQKGIQNLVTIKDRIASLKAEQKALNTETVEGKKTFEAYNAQIKALTKEQRSLELAVEKTAAGFEYESGSIAANRAELSKLTAEYKNLANPTKEQTAKIKQLSDTLKEQESAIGNNTRNVGNYKEALVGIQSQLGAFGPQVQQLTVGFNGVTQGLKVASAGFKTLGGAIATTGIGVLLLLLGQLISYFKNTDDGATKLEGIMGALGAVTKEITGVFTEFGGRLFDILSGAESLGDSLSELGDLIIQNLVNRFNSITVAGDAVVKFFKGDFKGAAKTGFDAIVQFQTGITDASGKLSSYASELAEAAKVAFAYAIKLDAINDAQRELDVTNARSNKIVQELIITAKNKTKTDQERIELLTKANEIEEKSVLKQKALDEQRLALIQERNLREQESFNSKLKRDLEEAKSEEKKAKIRKDALQVSDKLAQEEADLQKKLIDAETSFIQLKEKNQNKIDALNEQIAADRQKAYDAYVKQLKDINTMEISLENERQARVIANLDYELSKTDLNSTQRNVLLRLKYEEEKALQQKLLDDKLAALTTASLEEGANQDAINLQKIAVEEEFNQKQLEVDRKYQDDLTASNQAAEKKRTDDIKKENEERKKQREKDYADAKNTISEAANFASNINQISLENNLRKNEKARKEELESSSKDKATQDKINKKFDKLAADEQRKAAKTDLTIKEIQVGANAALSISQALASSPPPASFVLAALAGVAALAQVSAMEQQKSKLAKGGLIHIGGNPHSAGGTTFRGTDGTVFEAERNEVLAVVNKHDAPKLDYLSKINSVHGNPFYSSANRPPMRRNHFADGGIVARNTGGGIQDNQQQINAMQESIRNLQVVVGVKDIVTGVENKAMVVDRANI